MRIIELRATNIKRLVAVQITPDKDVVEITGKNGNGKSSVLDAIWWALSGAKQIQKKPIRDGEEVAEVFLDLGKFTVRRRFIAQEDGDYTTSLKVTNKDGSKFSNAQSVLNAVMGKLSFDPLAFTRMKPKEQFDLLKTFVPGVDFDDITTKNGEDFDARTEVNRAVRALMGHLDGIDLDALPEERIDVDALVNQMADLSKHNSALQKQRDAHQRSLSDLEGSAKREQILTARMAELRDEHVRVKNERDDLRTAIVAERADLESLDEIPQDADASDIQEAIREAADNNKAWELRECAAKWQADLDKQQNKAKQLTEAIEARNKAIKAAVAKAEIPVTGVGFEEEAITLDGKPFDQASDAQQLQASIEIAAAQNPELRVLRIRDGSLLDDDAMIRLSAFAADKDMQIWIERVDSSGEVGFVIEDGRVKGQTIEEDEE